MKYIIKKLSTDFLFDELEQVRMQFVDSLTYTMESSKVSFDKEAVDPLDIYIEYDFQQKDEKSVVHGFNLGEEIARNFELDVNQYHSSKQLLKISKNLKDLADELENKYRPESATTLAETKDKKDTDYAEKINRSFREVLKDAVAKDKAAQKEHVLNGHKKEFIDAEYKLNSEQTPSLK
ncbi:hypothetical protein BMR07_05065 [Methylococcaceae bacterium CS1]|nr:hypothetical protein [Methyloprofundus sp.]TXK98255.1 hypothetical protein BMR10_03035 [Methylococcaceae bacterium CS4]TXK98452.1 hypothetical protein BMR11_08305 [Methylococcaceae bacterium CS5]TXL06307.1 hypothetical protein BMR09_08315 [Methylococcaceae bacterium CS3]TXL07309.1 hypothetical protein BMR07_05065 [Methylococcaceae bacterium CS1]TXL11155.1 hypothetical protein BMR08_05660 [Methylococcaceae bacterium CS2]